jgi:WD40 repeat protein
MLTKLDGQPGAVFTLAWSPDGARVAVAGFDGMIRLMDPVTGKVVKEFAAVPLKTAKAP